MSRLMIAAALLAVALTGVAHASGEGWYEDYDAAVKAAKEESKDLLIDFSGSDWCGWCQRLDQEVFKHAAFLDAAKKEYVLVVLDFPKGEEAKAKVPDPARNQELLAKWGVTGYPTVLLTDADGNVFGRTGYQQGGPEKYVEHLAALRATGKPGLANALSVRKAAEDAKGDRKVPALTAVLDLMEKVKDEPFASVLIPGVKAAFAADPDGALGLRSRALETLIGAGVTDGDVKAAVLQSDPQNASGLYERFVEAMMSRISSREQLPDALATIEGLFAAGAVQDPKRAVNFRASAAFWCHQFLNLPEKAKGHATALKALNPDNPRIQQLIKQILGE